MKNIKKYLSYLLLISLSFSSTLLSINITFYPRIYTWHNQKQGYDFSNPLRPEKVIFDIDKEENLHTPLSTLLHKKITAEWFTNNNITNPENIRWVLDTTHQILRDHEKKENIYSNLKHAGALVPPDGPELRNLTLSQIINKIGKEKLTETGECVLYGYYVPPQQSDQFVYNVQYEDHETTHAAQITIDETIITIEDLKNSAKHKLELTDKDFDVTFNDIILSDSYTITSLTKSIVTPLLSGSTLILKSQEKQQPTQKRSPEKPPIEEKGHETLETNKFLYIGGGLGLTVLIATLIYKKIMNKKKP